MPDPAPPERRLPWALVATAVLLLLALGGLILLARGGRTPPPPPPPPDPVAQAVEYSERFQQMVQHGGDIATGVQPEVRRLAEANPACFEAQLLLGQVYIALDQLDAAYPPIERALALRPDGRELTKMLATLAYQNAKPAEAERLYRLVIGRAGASPERGQVRAMLAAVLAKQDRLDEADAEYAAALADNPLLVPAQLAYIELALRRGQSAAALQRVEDGLVWAGQDPRNDLSPFEAAKARALLAAGRTAEARQVLESCARPARESAPLTRAWSAYYERLTKLQLAALTWEELADQLALPPAEPERNSAAEKARLQIRLEAHREAARLYRAAGLEAEAARQDGRAAALTAKP